MWSDFLFLDLEMIYISLYMNIRNSADPVGSTSRVRAFLRLVKRIYPT